MLSKTHICLFDRVQLFRDSHVVEQFQTSKCRDLLAIVAMSPNHRVERSVLAKLLWGKQDYHSLGNRLSVCIYLLRKDLKRASIDPDDVLIVTPRAVGLVMEKVEVDWDNFDANIEVARADPTRRDECYLEAIKLYRGPLLAAISSPWVDAGRLDAARKHVEAVLWLAEQCPDDDAKRQLLREAVAKDPWDEKASHRFLQLLSESGDSVEALNYAHQLTNQAIQLGVPVSSEVLAVVESIADRDPSQEVRKVAATIRTAFVVSREHQKVFDRICESVGAYASVQGVFDGTDPLMAKMIAEELLDREPGARLLMHTYIDDGGWVSDAVQKLHESIPGGEIWATAATAALMAQYENKDNVEAFGGFKVYPLKSKGSYRA